MVSGGAACLLLLLLAWLTSGSWTPSRVRWFDVALVLPALGAAKLGFGRGATLVLSFLAYWAIAFAILWRYIRRTGLQVRSHDQGAGEA